MAIHKGAGMVVLARQMRSNSSHLKDLQKPSATYKPPYCGKALGSDSAKCPGKDRFTISL